MRSAPYHSSPDQQREPLWRRGTALILTLVIHGLGFIVLLTLAPPLSHIPKAPEPKVFRLTPPPEPRIAPKPSPSGAQAKQRAGGGAPRSPAPPAPAAATAPAPPPPLNILLLSKEEFAASDIARLRSQRPPGGDGGAGAGAGRDSGSAFGPGEGPGGERLYNAEWYVEPTDAEIAFYMPAKRPRVGWATIACRTIENYRVENCRQLSESPPGSGLSRALRLAAWQFRVRPPRIGGRPIIGAWVRIRFDFTEGAAK